MLTETAYDLPSWNAVADQLVAAGSIAEAGTTLLFHMGVSPPLAVFSTALALAKGTSPEEKVSVQFRSIYLILSQFLFIYKLTQQPNSQLKHQLHIPAAPLYREKAGEMH